MGRFKKGLFLGGLLGAGLVWLNTTKKGKDVRDQLIDHSAEVYASVKKKAMESDAWEQMTKNKYVAMVKEAVDTYAIKNGLADNVKQMIVKLVSAQWKHLRSEKK